MRNCPACGSSGKEKFTANINTNKISSQSYASRKVPELMHYGLLECTECRTLFVENPPSTTELVNNYVEATFDSHIESEYAAVTYCKYLDRLSIIRDKRILDIGCGDGTFLRQALTYGATSAQGVEPSLRAIEDSQEMREFISCISIEQSTHEAEFDLTTCFQTLEHLVDPANVISKMYESVVDEGYVAIVCHNRLSIVNKLLGRRSPIFDIEHLQMFSTKGLEILLRDAGLEVLYSQSIINSYPFGYWLRLAPFPNRLKEFIERHRKSSILSSSVSLAVGNHLIVGRKPKCTTKSN